VVLASKPGRRGKRERGRGIIQEESTWYLYLGMPKFRGIFKIELRFDLFTPTTGSIVSWLMLKVDNC
jgi:hypothetical protein